MNKATLKLLHNVYESVLITDVLTEFQESATGKRSKFVVTGHGKYEKVPVDSNSEDANCQSGKTTSIYVGLLLCYCSNFVVVIIIFINDFVINKTFNLSYN